MPHLGVWNSPTICALILRIWNPIISVSGRRLSVSGIHGYLVASFSGLTA